MVLCLLSVTLAFVYVSDGYEKASESWGGIVTNEECTDAEDCNATALSLLQTRMSLSRGEQEPSEMTLIRLSGRSNDPNGKKREIQGFKIPGMTGFKKHKIHELERPIWQKTLRCTGPSQTTCTPCSGKSDCWTWNTGPISDLSSAIQSMRANRNTRFRRFISSVHVQCAAPRIGIVFTPTEVKGGTLRFFWDGVEITKANGFTMETNDNYAPVLFDAMRKRKPKKRARKGNRKETRKAKKQAQFRKWKGAAPPSSPRFLPRRGTQKEMKQAKYRKWTWDVSRPGGHELTMEFTKAKVPLRPLLHVFFLVVEPRRR
eukprot:gnl/TRDRNA2_/TRDRNA2_94511_c0_seq1.p1 gnl/TRDRNA2_/TRDRNA2_94511_c0~~gnl/TRDRNA2_/TRDRNA2_94511_c0_seq1.p1  ORF type:complete len:316 (+),score=27.79 gnl/TRDRNA2_/TRDRNA2_94511_c0_seq1:142-1089(+)